MMRNHWIFGMRVCLGCVMALDALGLVLVSDLYIKYVGFVPGRTIPCSRF